MVRCSADDTKSSDALAFVLRDVYRLIRRRFIQRARSVGFGLKYSEAVLLFRIGEEQGINQATLAAQLDIESITVVSLLDGLEKADLIERRPHPRDRRQWTLWLTATAGPTLKHIRAITEAAQKEALVGFRPESGSDLMSALAQVKMNLTHATKHKRQTPVPPAQPPTRAHVKAPR